MMSAILGFPMASNDERRSRVEYRQSIAEQRVLLTLHGNSYWHHATAIFDLQFSRINMNEFSSGSLLSISPCYGYL
jgi:hypothetical protein